MNDFWNWFLLIYGTVGVTWSFWALYIQYKLNGNKKLFLCWASNLIVWPISIGILVKRKLNFTKVINWYLDHDYATVPITVIIGVLAIIVVAVIGVDSLISIESKTVDDNPVIETVQLGKVVEGWYITTNNMKGRTKIETEHLTVIVSGIRNVTKGKNAHINNHKNDDKYFCIEGEKYCWGMY